MKPPLTIPVQQPTPIFRAITSADWSRNLADARRRPNAIMAAIRERSAHLTTLPLPAGSADLGTCSAQQPPRMVGSVLAPRE